MSITKGTAPVTAVLAAIVSLLAARSAPAQTIEWLGTRALGMGGAFVGVADDATAVYWNPAGLATGATASGVFEIGGTDVLTDKSAPITAGLAASRVSHRIVASTATSFGLSSYRLVMTDVRPAPTALDVSAGALTRLSTSHYGLTLLQTVSEGVVIGGTMKLIRGTASSGPIPQAGTLDEALDSAESLPSRRTTKFDLDVGAMLVFGIVRAGLVLRNVREPEFALADPSLGSIQLRRHTRAGIAVTPGRTGAAPGSLTTIGVDLDLTRVDTPRGRQRDFAAGAERWLFGGRVGVRGGLRLNLLDKAQRAGAAGLSVALRPRSYVDAHVSRGRVSGDKSWGVSARVTF